MNLSDRSDRLRQLVTERAQLFVIDNYRAPTPSDFLVIENAMLIGATIATQVEMEATRDEIEGLKGQS